MTQLTTMQVTVTCGSKVAIKTINTSIITTNQRPRFTEPDVSALSSRKSLKESYPGPELMSSRPNLVTNARFFDLPLGKELVTFSEYGTNNVEYVLGLHNHAM
jgi:hypothetical protein